MKRDRSAIATTTKPAGPPVTPRLRIRRYQRRQATVIVDIDQPYAFSCRVWSGKVFARLLSFNNETHFGFAAQGWKGYSLDELDHLEAVICALRHVEVPS